LLNGFEVSDTVDALVNKPPSKGVCTGNDDALSIRANVVCGAIKLHGNPQVDITYYNSKQNFQFAPFLELSQ